MCSIALSNLLIANAAASGLLGGRRSIFLSGTPNLMRIVFPARASRVHRDLGGLGAISSQG